MSGDDTDAPDAAGRWLPASAAARALGITERSVRRRVAAGRLRARRTRQGTRVWVADADRPDAADAEDDGEDDGDAPDVRARTPADPSGAARLTVPVEVWREERERASRAEQAAAMWQERSANLAAELERLLALPAHEEERPPWWRLIWRRPRNR